MMCVVANMINNMQVRFANMLSECRVTDDFLGVHIGLEHVVS